MHKWDQHAAYNPCIYSWTNNNNNDEKKKKKQKKREYKVQTQTHRTIADEDEAKNGCRV